MDYLRLFFSWDSNNAIALAQPTLHVDAVFSAFSDVLVSLTDQLVGEEEHQTSHATDRFLHPHSVAAQPVYRGLGTDTDDVVAYIYSTVSWDKYLLKLLPEEVKGIFVVLRNSCGQSVTYELNGAEAIVLADSDIHDPSFDSQAVSLDFTENYFDPTLTSEIDGHCQVFLDVYPTKAFEESYQSNLSVAFSFVVAGLFVIMAVAFFIYDWFVQSRNNLVVGVATRADAIVGSLFPTDVKDRLMEEQQQKNDESKRREKDKQLDHYLVDIDHDTTNELGKVLP